MTLFSSFANIHYIKIPKIVLFIFSILLDDVSF